MLLNELSAHDVPPLKISKTLKLPVLLDPSEMEDLLKVLGSPHFYLIQGVNEKEKGVLNSHDFLGIYTAYIQSLMRLTFSAAFSSAMSVSPDCLVAIPIKENKQIIRAIQPIIQLQHNKITYSKEEGLFRTQLYGEGGIEWGIQFSYPLLYQDPLTQDIQDVGSQFPNTKTFKDLQKWIRHHTLPTPFMVGGKRINAPIRLGKKCFSWIHTHPDLKEKRITIV